MTKRSPFKYFKTSPEIIRLAVMLYVRFPLSLRNVEDRFCHVWTAPFVQGLIWVNVDRRRLRSCVRPDHRDRSRCQRT